MLKVRRGGILRSCSGKPSGGASLKVRKNWGILGADVGYILHLLRKTLTPKLEVVRALRGHDGREQKLYPSMYSVIKSPKVLRSRLEGKPTNSKRRTPKRRDLFRPFRGSAQRQ